MPRYIIIALILGGVLLFILQIVHKFYSGISGTRSAVKDDFKELDKLVDKFELAPWQHEELDLISRNYDVSAQSQLYARIEHGQFYSIYDEPILAFAVKEYVENDRKLAVVKYNKKKFHFNVLEDQVELSEKGKVFGKVTIDDGLSIEHQEKRLHIDANTTAGLIPLSINDEHVMSIASEDEHTTTTGRMLHKFNDHDENESELILLSIAFALANKQI